MVVITLHVMNPSRGGGRRNYLNSHAGGFFATLRVNALLGRTLTEDDDKIPGGHPIAVISYNFWHRRFHLDGSVIGKAVDLNGAVFTIVGVAPPEFFGERVQIAPDYWLPLTRQAAVLQRELNLRGAGSLRVESAGFAAQRLFAFWQHDVAGVGPAVPTGNALCSTNARFASLPIRAHRS